MIVQESGPRLRSRMKAFRVHVFLDSALGDVDAELEEFAPNAFSTPQTIVPSHALDQGDRLGSNFWLPGSRLGTLTPEPVKEMAMPAEEGVGLDNHERLFPVAGSPCQDDQEQPIRLGRCWALHLTAENEQRLSKEHVFGDEISPGTSKIGEHSTQHGVGGWARPLVQALVDARQPELIWRLSELSQPDTGRGAP